MDKILKCEQQMMWMMWGIIIFFAADFVYSIVEGGDQQFRTEAIAFPVAIWWLSRRVIKELQRENESLKSDASTGSVDTTPPADEPATDE